MSLEHQDDSGYGPVSIPPEAHPSFRRGQLLLLLEQHTGPLTLERLNYLDFFSANPYLVIREDSGERTRLLLAGLNPVALSYQASKERYANRRTRLRSDLGALVAWGYASVTSSKGLRACVLTGLGRETAAGLTSLYADAYRESVNVIKKRFRRLTDTGISKRLQEWLDVDQFRIDLWDFEPIIDGEGQGMFL